LSDAPGTQPPDVNPPAATGDNGSDGPGPDSPSAGGILPGAPAPRPGSTTFSLEGRVAPGLYLVGWLASVMGLAILTVAILAGPGGLTGLALTLGSLLLLSVGLVAACGSQGLQRRAEADRRRGPERPDIETAAVERAAPAIPEAPWATATAAVPADALGIPRTVPTPGYLGPSPFLVFAASLPITVLATVAILGPASAAGLDTNSPLAALISVVLTAVVNIGLVQLLVVSTGALTWTEMGLPRVALPRAVSDGLAGAALALPVIVVTAVLGGLLVTLIGTAPPSPLPPAGGTSGFVINFVAATFIAPIGEETFYRAFATTAWVRAMPAWAAIVRGALFFAFVHVLTVGGTDFGDAARQAFIAFAVRLPVALALGWVFVRRRSLYASIGLHATYNGLLLIVGQLAPTG